MLRRYSARTGDSDLKNAQPHDSMTSTAGLVEESVNCKQSLTDHRRWASVVAHLPRTWAAEPPAKAHPGWFMPGSLGSAAQRGRHGCCSGMPRRFPPRSASMMLHRQAGPTLAGCNGAPIPPIPAPSRMADSHARSRRRRPEAATRRQGAGRARLGRLRAAPRAPRRTEGRSVAAAALGFAIAWPDGRLLERLGLRTAPAPAHAGGDGVHRGVCLVDVDANGRSARCVRGLPLAVELVVPVLEARRPAR